MTTEQIYRLFLKHPRVETDSRKVVEGSLFFALKGEHFNGNKFASEALNRGAAFAIIDEEEYAVQQKTIMVSNVLEALQHLANYHRRQLGIPIVGITGSNGKTTTKELIAAVLSSRYNIVYTQGNLNNHIGVPLTLLKMDHNTELGIIEMGANHAGEIATLSAIADPDYGIITNIGIAHIEGFGSFDVIKKTKAELYDHIRTKNGLIFYNCDNPVLNELAEGIQRKISFGTHEADFMGELVSSAPMLQVRIHFPPGTLEINTQLIGDYNFENLLAAACIGNYFKIEPTAVKAALSSYRSQNNRSQLIEKKDLKIIMDAYNANPTSMKASIESFISNFPFSRSLILGDMLELGEIAMKEHISVLKQISQHSFDNVFLVGPVFTEAAKAFPYKTFLHIADLIQHLRHTPPVKGTVLIKGSRGIQLEKVEEYL